MVDIVKHLKGRVSMRKRGAKAQKTSSLLEWVRDRVKQVKANDGSILRDQLEPWICGNTIDIVLLPTSCLNMKKYKAL